jgi:hypothetical protein
MTIATAPSGAVVRQIIPNTQMPAIVPTMREPRMRRMRIVCLSPMKALLFTGQFYIHIVGAANECLTVQPNDSDK